jgi:L-fuculose-phosphate aldolase
MSASEQELRAQIVDIGKWMHGKGWVAANDGNISTRLPDGRILCTPTRISKGRMRPEDLIIVDGEGRKLEGERQTTSEIFMHLTIYSQRPGVQAVVHAHTPFATGFAAAGKALNLAMLPEVVVLLGSVPLAPYGLPGTPALSESLLPLIPRYDAILMANHGVVTYGGDLEDAYYKMETVEHFARIAFVAEQLGGAQVLPRREVEKLIAAREHYGVHCATTLEAHAPVVAEDEPLLGRPGREELIGLIDEVLRSRGVHS